jgi:hypothetical protein
MIIYSPTFTGSVQLTGSQIVTGDFTVRGNLTAQQFILSSSVTFYTESFSSGSTRFGDSMDDTMTVTGSLRLTGSIGVGTALPAARLHISGTTGILLEVDGVNAVNALVVSSSGNVGIGTATPENNLHISSTTGSLKVGSTATTAGCVPFIEFIHAGNDAFRITGGSDLRFLTSGVNERMRITNAGNVGIGTTNPTSTLHIQTSIASGQVVRIQTSLAAGRNYVQWANGSGDMGYLGYGAADGRFFIVNQLNSDMLFYTNDAERMRITSTGDVEIKNSNANSYIYLTNALNTSTTSKNTILQFRGTDTGNSVKDTGAIQVVPTGINYIDANMIFYVRGSDSQVERMRINHTGAVSISAVSSGTLSAINSSAGTGTTSIYSEMGVNTNNTTSYHFIGAQAGFGNRIQIFGNGNIVNSNNSYGPISDIKLKENITDATPKLEDLLQVRIVNYNLIADPDLKQIGVIAQEVEEIFPGLVDEHPDKDAEGNDLGTTTKSVKMSVFTPILIKAIQELKAEIEELKNK